MKRHSKPLVLFAALAVALVLTVTRHGKAGLGIGAGSPSSALPGIGGPGGRDKKVDITALHVFDATLMRINDSYVDPTRVDPKQMFLAALDWVQRAVAEVMVTPDPKNNKVTVKVDTAQKVFDISDVDSPWTLSVKMREVFKFIAQNLQPGTDAKDIEYAATNGMLSTLDPHSMLLDPTQYGEMKLSTKGKFGGLGIVIGVRKGALTVIRPMPNTPASRAGVQAGDKIVRIEKESTVNMMLNDAVSRLRGDPDTSVDVWLQRGTAEPKKYTLKREEINVNSVVAQYMKSGIGYIKLKQFSGNTYDEMHKYLEQFKAEPQGLKGVVLDLRGDPGGLLDQAIRVADEFLDAGTIVTTVGYANKQRDEKRAKPEGTQPHIPIAVLVNGGSASASEIVAGALKNLDRAVIIGQRTFGKGSVQVLYDNEDGSALKLTIAQYLTPGDVSIQSVGIVPDVQVAPAVVTADRVALFGTPHGLHEKDLDAHLESKNAKTGDKPFETMRYLFEQKPKKDAKTAAGKLLRNDDDKAGAGDDDDDSADDTPTDDDDKFVDDYEITLARELLAQAKGWHRREVISNSKPFFEKKTAEEQTRITAALGKLGVDWSTGGGGGPVKLATKLATDKANNEVKAGETLALTAEVTNKGPQTLSQVRAITRSDDPLVDGRELVFGKLKPGETRSWKVPIKVDRSALSRLDPIKVEVFAGDVVAKAPVAETEKIAVKLDGLARPRFAYAWQLIDDVPGNQAGNKDGLVEVGEGGRLHLVVKNVGDGTSYETNATLSNKSGDGVNVNKGRFELGPMKPGDEKSFDFTFDVEPDFRGEQVSLEMDVFDTVLREFVSDKINLPIVPVTVAEKTLAGAVTLTADADVRAGASTSAEVIGRAAKGATFPTDGQAGDFYRVTVAPGRQGFVAAGSVQVKAGAAPASALAGFTPALQVMPPRLVLNDPPLAVDATSFKLDGTATDSSQVTDVFVYVSNRGAKIDHRKVFYLSNRKAQDPKHIAFDASVPLWPGANQVTVVARQSNSVQSQQTLIIQGKGDAPTETATAD